MLFRSLCVRVCMCLCVAQVKNEDLNAVTSLIAAGTDINAQDSVRHMLCLLFASCNCENSMLCAHAFCAVYVHICLTVCVELYAYACLWVALVREHSTDAGG